MKLNLYLTSYTKIKSKWIKEPNLRTKTIKLLEESTGENLYDIRFGKDFMDMTPKVQATSR